MQKVIDAMIEIEPLIGMGSVKFGMSIVEVIKAGCLADDWLIQRISIAKESHIQISSATDCVSLTFRPDDNYRLGVIELSAPNTYFGGLNLYGLSVKQTQEAIADMELQYLLDDTAGDEDSAYAWISVESKSAQIFFLEGKVESLAYFPDYDLQDNPIWPTQ